MATDSGVSATDNPVTYIQQFAGRIKLIHLKDYRIRFDTAVFAEGLSMEAIRTAFSSAVQFAGVGEGNLAMKEIIDAGLACGSEYFLVEQDDTYGRDPFDCLITSRDNLIELGYQDWFVRG